MALFTEDWLRYLKVLELQYDAKEDDIKRAYKKLALKYHPDKCLNDPNATAKFQELSAAYYGLMKILDRERRRTCCGCGFYHYDDESDCSDYDSDEEDPSESDEDLLDFFRRIFYDVFSEFVFKNKFQSKKRKRDMHTPDEEDEESFFDFLSKQFKSQQRQPRPDLVLTEEDLRKFHSYDEWQKARDPNKRRNSRCRKKFQQRPKRRPPQEEQKQPTKKDILAEQQRRDKEIKEIRVQLLKSLEEKKEKEQKKLQKLRGNVDNVEEPRQKSQKRGSRSPECAEIERQLAEAKRKEEDLQENLRVLQAKEAKREKKQRKLDKRRAKKQEKENQATPTFNTVREEFSQRQERQNERERRQDTAPSHTLAAGFSRPVDKLERDRGLQQLLENVKKKQTDLDDSDSDEPEIKSSENRIPMTRKQTASDDSSETGVNTSNLQKHLDAYHELMKQQPKRHTEQQLKEERNRIKEAQLKSQQQELYKLRTLSASNRTNEEDQFSRREELLRKQREKERLRNEEEARQISNDSSQRKPWSAPVVSRQAYESISYHEKHSQFQQPPRLLPQTARRSVPVVEHPIKREIPVKETPWSQVVRSETPWGQRSRKQMAVETLLPRDIDEEEEMLQQALALSMTTAKEDKHRIRKRMEYEEEMMRMRMEQEEAEEEMRIQREEEREMARRRRLEQEEEEAEINRRVMEAASRRERVTEAASRRESAQKKQSPKADCGPVTIGRHPESYQMYTTTDGTVVLDPNTNTPTNRSTRRRNPRSNQSWSLCPGEPANDDWSFSPEDKTSDHHDDNKRLLPNMDVDGSPNFKQNFTIDAKQYNSNVKRQGGGRETGYNRGIQGPPISPPLPSSGEWDEECKPQLEAPVYHHPGYKPIQSDHDSHVKQKKTKELVKSDIEEKEEEKDKEGDAQTQPSWMQQDKVREQFPSQKEDNDYDYQFFKQEDGQATKSSLHTVEKSKTVQGIAEAPPANQDQIQNGHPNHAPVRKEVDTNTEPVAKPQPPPIPVLPMMLDSFTQTKVSTGFVGGYWDSASNNEDKIPVPDPPPKDEPDPKLLKEIPLRRPNFQSQSGFKGDRNRNNSQWNSGNKEPEARPKDSRNLYPNNAYLTNEQQPSKGGENWEDNLIETFSTMNVENPVEERKENSIAINTNLEYSAIPRLPSVPAQDKAENQQRLMTDDQKLSDQHKDAPHMEPEKVEDTTKLDPLSGLPAGLPPHLVQAYLMYISQKDQTSQKPGQENLQKGISPDNVQNMTSPQTSPTSGSSVPGLPPAAFMPPMFSPMYPWMMAGAVMPQPVVPFMPPFYGYPLQQQMDPRQLQSGQNPQQFNPNPVQFNPNLQSIPQDSRSQNIPAQNQNFQPHSKDLQPNAQSLQPVQPQVHVEAHHPVQNSQGSTEMYPQSQKTDLTIPQTVIESSTNCKSMAKHPNVSDVHTMERSEQVQHAIASSYDSMLRQTEERNKAVENISKLTQNLTNSYGRIPNNTASYENQPQHRQEHSGFYENHPNQTQSHVEANLNIDTQIQNHAAYNGSALSHSNADYQGNIPNHSQDTAQPSSSTTSQAQSSTSLDGNFQDETQPKVTHGGFAEDVPLSEPLPARTDTTGNNRSRFIRTSLPPRFQKRLELKKKIQSFIQGIKSNEDEYIETEIGNEESRVST